MYFYVNFGKDKNKWNSITQFGPKQKLSFNIVISQRNKIGEREYAYLKCETWNQEIINTLQEKTKYKLKDFYFRFWKDIDKRINFVLVIEKIEGMRDNEKVNLDDDIFGDDDKNPWELDF